MMKLLPKSYLFFEYLLAALSTIIYVKEGLKFSQFCDCIQSGYLPTNSTYLDINLCSISNVGTF